jgi:hypothetical protein
MDRVRGPRPVSGRGRPAALLTGLVGLATVSITQSPSSAHAITATTDVGAIVIAPSS